MNKFKTNHPNKSIYNSITDWGPFEDFNNTDAKLKALKLKELNINVTDPGVIGILSKSNFVIPGLTRYECIQCGECCRYARKVANLTYEPCLFLTSDNKCSKHNDNYNVCKWFPFWRFTDPKYGNLLTIKPYCSGYNKGKLIDYDSTMKNLIHIESLHKNDDDGAVVIHEVLYLPEKKTWFFPSRKNINELLQYINKEHNFNKVKDEKSREIYYAQQYTSGLLGSINDPQATIDEKGNITDANDAFLSLCKTELNKIVGVSFSNLFNDKESIETNLKLCFSKEKITALPQRLRLSNNSIVNVLINGQAYRDRNDGLIHSILVSINEISSSLYNEIVSSKEYARNIIEASIDSMMTIDINGLITDVNEACCDLFGYSRDKIKGSKFSEYFDNPSMALTGVNLTYENKTLKNYELTLINNHGHIIPVSFNASVYKSSEGNTLGVIAIARDIRDIKELITELENAKQYARGLIESSIDMMLTIDVNGIITDINEAVVLNTGYDRKYIIGSKFSTYFIDQELAKKGVKITFAQTQVKNYTLILVTKSGSNIKVSFNASLYKNSKDIVQGIFAIARIEN